MSERQIDPVLDLLVVAFAGSMMVLVAAGALPARAHAATDWYAAKWRNVNINGVQNDKRVEWRFTAGFPTGDGWRERTREGAYGWSEVNGATMSFNFESGAPDYGSMGFDTCDTDANAYQKDKVGSGDFGASGWNSNEPIALTATCVWPGGTDTLHSFKIKLNEDAPLFTGDGEPPAGKWDVESAMAHEFGHAAGRTKSPSGNGRGGHFAESSTLCPGPGSADFGSRHTMCPRVYDGTRMMRTLQDHDKDAFKNAYS